MILHILLMKSAHLYLMHCLPRIFYVFTFSPSTWSLSEHNYATTFKIIAVLAEWVKIYSHLDVTPADKMRALVSKVHTVHCEIALSPAQKFPSAHGSNLPEGSADIGIQYSSQWQGYLWHFLHPSRGVYTSEEANIKYFS